MLREGTRRANISAVFDASDAQQAWLAERDIDASNELGDQLVDIHGQHAHQSLLRADAQRDLQNANGDHAELRQAVAQAWKAWRQTASRLEAAERDASILATERDRLQWQADELDRLDLLGVGKPACRTRPPGPRPIAVGGRPADPRGAGRRRRRATAQADGRHPAHRRIRGDIRPAKLPGQTGPRPS